MPEILLIINGLKHHFPRNFPTFLAIIGAMLCMSGPKTMLNISRWTPFCYKTIERFYERRIPWLELNWSLLKNFAPITEAIIASDETIAKKSGKKTYGLDFFFSSILQKTVKSICFSGISVIHPYKKRSYPLLFTQLVFTPHEKEAAHIQMEKRRQAKGSKVGRPKGSLNKKGDKPLAPTFRLLKEQLTQVKSVIPLGIKHFVGDGKYGNQTCARICHEFDYDLVSKLQYNSVLYFKYEGPYQGAGRPRIYGERIDYKNVDDKYLVHEEEFEGETTKIYHLPNLIRKSFDCPLNIVLIQKRKAKRVSQVILFSTDLGLSHQTIIDYYSSRFQIEFNFRDAKQFWGLEDFMNIKENRIHNAANLAFFMVNVSTLLLAKFRIKTGNPLSGIRDLIAAYRAEKYYRETLKLLRKFNPHILIPEHHEPITSLGLIHS